MIWLQSNLEFQILPPFFVGNEVPDATARLADTLKVSGVVNICRILFSFASHAAKQGRGGETGLQRRSVC